MSQKTDSRSVKGTHSDQTKEVVQDYQDINLVVQQFQPVEQNNITSNEFVIGTSTSSNQQQKTTGSLNITGKALSKKPSSNVVAEEISRQEQPPQVTKKDLVEFKLPAAVQANMAQQRMTQTHSKKFHSFVGSSNNSVSATNNGTWRIQDPISPAESGKLLANLNENERINSVAFTIGAHSTEIASTQNQNYADEKQTNSNRPSPKIDYTEQRLISHSTLNHHPDQFMLPKLGAVPRNASQLGTQQIFVHSLDPIDQPLNNLGQNSLEIVDPLRMGAISQNHLNLVQNQQIRKRQSESIPPMRMHNSLADSDGLKHLKKDQNKGSRLTGRNKSVFATMAAPLSDQLDEAFARGNWKKNKSGPKGLAPSRRLVEALNKISDLPIEKSELISKASGKVFGVNKRSYYGDSQRSKSVLMVNESSKFLEVQESSKKTEFLQRLESGAQNFENQQVSPEDPRSELKKKSIREQRKVREQLKDIDCAEQKPKIQFPIRGVGMDGQKKANLSQKRLDALSMPGHIIEEWIDEILKGDDEQEAFEQKINKVGENGQEQSPEGKEKDSVPQRYNKKVSDKASVRYGVDLASLIKEGLSHDDSRRLQRALYVHSIGLYNVFQDCLKGVKYKKNVIVGAMRIFYHLFEKCQPTDYKLMINEVAEQLEAENKKTLDKYAEDLIASEKHVQLLQMELKERNDMIDELERSTGKVKDDFLRLQETYTILQKQNEEGLSLRLQTETRLKELFRHEREMREQLKIEKRDRNEWRDTISQNTKTIEELKGQIHHFKEVIVGLEYSLKITKDTLGSRVRELSDLQVKVHDLEGPQLELKQDLMFKTNVAMRRQVEINDLQVKMGVFKARAEEFEADNLRLQADSDFNKKMNEELVERNKDLKAELTSTQETLQQKKETFDNIERIIAEKTESLLSLEEQFKQAWIDRQRFDLENQHYKLQNQELTRKNEDFQTQLEAHAKKTTEYEKNNYEMQLQIDKYDEEMDKLQEKLSNAEKEHTRLNVDIIAKLNCEVVSLKDDMANQHNYMKRMKANHDEEIERHNTLVDQMRKEHTSTQGKFQMALKECQEGRLDNKRLRQQNHQLAENILKEEERRKKGFKEFKDIQVERVVMKDKIRQLQLQLNSEKVVSETQDNQIAIHEVNELKTVQTQNEQIKIMQQQIDRADDKIKQFIDMNSMLGEDLRSQAHENYIKIQELNAFIEEVRKEPDRLRIKLLQKKTQKRRLKEKFSLKFEEIGATNRALLKRIERLQKHIELRDMEINRVNIENKLMHGKMRPEFEVNDQGMQASVLMLEKEIEAVVRKQNVGTIMVQKPPVKTNDEYSQTEPEISGYMAMTMSEVGKPKLPRKKILHKKGAKQRTSNNDSVDKNDRDSSNSSTRKRRKGKSPLGIGERSPARHESDLNPDNLAHKNYNVKSPPKKLNHSKDRASKVQQNIKEIALDLIGDELNPVQIPSALPSDHSENEQEIEKLSIQDDQDNVQVNLENISEKIESPISRNSRNRTDYSLGFEHKKSPQMHLGEKKQAARSRLNSNERNLKVETGSKAYEKSHQSRLEPTDVNEESSSELAEIQPSPFMRKAKFKMQKRPKGSKEAQLQQEQGLKGSKSPKQASHANSQSTVTTLKNNLTSKALLQQNSSSIIASAISLKSEIKQAVRVPTKRKVDSVKNLIKVAYTRE